MSNPRSKYGIDKTKESQGSEVKIDDMVFVVRSASASNRAYRYALALAAAVRRDQLKAAGVQAFDVHEDVLIEAFSNAVITGWSGVDGDDGNPLPFTPENCFQLMQDCPLIWDRIREVALDDDRFKLTKEDGDSLGKSSSGT